MREYIGSVYEEEVKVKRLYNEVRYARMSSMSLKPTATVFCLKRNHKNLPPEEYADNLCLYLCSARSCKTITIEDLNNIMHGIASKNIAEVAGISIQLRSEVAQSANNTDPSGNQSNFVTGEHVIAFWCENESVKWHLGIVDALKNKC